MRATQLKPGRKVGNGAGLPRPEVACEIAVYLRRYEEEREAWLASRGDSGVAPVAILAHTPPR